MSFRGVYYTFCFMSYYSITKTIASRGRLSFIFPHVVLHNRIYSLQRNFLCVWRVADSFFGSLDNQMWGICIRHVTFDRLYPLNYMIIPQLYLRFVYPYSLL